MSAQRHGHQMPTTNILVIEEEALLALDIEDILVEAGLGPVLHHRSVAAARPHLVEPSGIDLAIIEAHLGAAEVVAFVERLVRSGVAVVVMSADNASTQLFPRAAGLGKPFDAAGLLAACRAAKVLVS